MDFTVDPAGLRSGGRDVAGAGARAERDLRRLRDDTAAGPAWGTDLGAAAAYDDLAGLTAEALDLVGAVLAKSGAGMQRMAESYEHADGAARDGFGRIGRSA